MTPLVHDPIVRTMCRLLAALALAAWLGGCAAPLPQSRALQDGWPANLPRSVELADVPFHAQRDYECGPAALAMALEGAGAQVPLATLIEQVYVPQRRGSLQVEMLATPRRHGIVSYELAPRFDDLLREVAAGTPVIVLHNYGLWGGDLWHYAVVAGYDADAGEIVMRSGERERITMAFPAFEHFWRRSGYWAMVAVPPARVPATASEARHLQAAAAMERVAGSVAAIPAYAAASQRWPGSVTARIALANAHHERGDLESAAAVLREAERLAPDSAVVLNNLAQTLSDQGHHEEGLALAERALRLASPHEAAVRHTRDAIASRIAASGATSER